jgi:hypothetical protein
LSRTAKARVFADNSEILIVARTLIGVAFEAQCLKVTQIVSAPEFSRKNVLHFEGSFVCRNAAQFATEASALQNFVAQASRQVANGGSAVIVDSRSTFLQVCTDLLIAELNYFVLLIWG